MKPALVIVILAQPKSDSLFSLISQICLSQKWTRMESKQDLIDEYFSISSDGIECSAGLSLLCPINLKQIRLPVKGKDCSHMAYFCFFNFMSLYAENCSVMGIKQNCTGHLKCPMCCNTLYFSSLKISLFLFYLIRDINEHKQQNNLKYDSISLDRDGGYRPILDQDVSTQG